MASVIKYANVLKYAKQIDGLKLFWHGGQLLKRDAIKTIWPDLDQARLSTVWKEAKRRRMKPLERYIPGLLFRGEHLITIEGLLQRRLIYQHFILKESVIVKQPKHLRIWTLDECNFRWTAGVLLNGQKIFAATKSWLIAQELEAACPSQSVYVCGCGNKLKFTVENLALRPDSGFEVYPKCPHCNLKNVVWLSPSNYKTIDLSDNIKEFLTGDSQLVTSW